MLFTDDLDKKNADAIFQLAEREEKALRASREGVGKSGTDHTEIRVLIFASGLLVDN